MLHNKSLSFDKSYIEYDYSRPEYPRDLYRLIDSLGLISNKSSVLEIGAGNGIATNEIYKFWQPKLTLIEPGVNFYNLLCNRFKHIGMRIVNSDFEGFDTDDSFDAIFAASAFHWISSSSKYHKLHSLLRNNGLLIIYGHHFGLNDDDVSIAVQKVYENHNIETHNRPCKFHKDIISLKLEIENSHLFTTLKSADYRWVKDYDAVGFINLLKTFINFANAREEFFSEIKHTIVKYGGIIKVNILSNILIAQKHVD